MCGASSSSTTSTSWGTGACSWAWRPCYVAASFVVVGVRGLNFGIEFVGGTSVAFHGTEGVTTEQMRTAFDQAGEPDAVIQTTVTRAAKRASWCAQPRRAQKKPRRERTKWPTSLGLVHGQLRGDHHRAGLGRLGHPVVAHRVPGVHRAHHRLHRHPLRIQDGHHGHRGAPARPCPGHGRVRAGGPRGEPEHHRRACSPFWAIRSTTRWSCSTASTTT